MKELLIIIPAYNEAENIIKVIEELRQEIDYADILVINDASRDNTLEVIQENNIECLSTPFNLGYAGVVQTGFKYAKQKAYPYVAQFDGDGQHIAYELHKLFKLAKETEADVVIGSRFKEKTKYKHPFFRRFGTTIFQKAIYLICNKNITDPTSGMQVIKEKVYTYYAQMNHYPDYPDANLIIEMLLLGCLIEEESVEMRERVLGVSMHAGIWKPVVYMVKMFYSLIIILVKYRKSIGLRSRVDERRVFF